jgi:hypothetical protein
MAAVASIATSVVVIGGGLRIVPNTTIQCRENGQATGELANRLLGDPGRKLVGNRDTEIQRGTLSWRRLTYARMMTVAFTTVRFLLLSCGI